MYFYFSSQMKAEGWTASLSFLYIMTVRRVTTVQYKPRKYLKSTFHKLYQLNQYGNLHVYST